MTQGTRLGGLAVRIDVCSRVVREFIAAPLGSALLCRDPGWRPALDGCGSPPLWMVLDPRRPPKAAKAAPLGVAGVPGSHQKDPKRRRAAALQRSPTEQKSLLPLRDGRFLN